MEKNWILAKWLICTWKKLGSCLKAQSRWIFCGFSMASVVWMISLDVCFYWMFFVNNFIFKRFPLKTYSRQVLGFCTSIHRVDEIFVGFRKEILYKLKFLWIIFWCPIKGEIICGFSSRLKCLWAFLRFHRILKFCWRVKKRHRAKMFVLSKILCVQLQCVTIRKACFN